MCDFELIMGEYGLFQVWGISWCCFLIRLWILIRSLFRYQMAREKGKKVVASTSSEKRKGKEEAPPSTRAPKALTITGSLELKAFGVTIRGLEAKRRWSHLIGLKHKQYRFLHHKTIEEMGIVDEVLTMKVNLDFMRIFQANYLV